MSKRSICQLLRDISCFSFKNTFSLALPHDTMRKQCPKYVMSLKSSKDEERAISVHPPMSLSLTAVLLMGKRGGRKETKVHQGLENINLGAHGWAVMRAPQQRALPSCSCYLWAEPPDPGAVGTHCDRPGIPGSRSTSKLLSKTGLGRG